ncbi:hypothetical protein BU25DRAFT_341250, partial [Macroventuria anomochaeta]
LVNIWVFADLRGIPALGNAAIDMLHERVLTGRGLSTEMIKSLFEETAAGSKLRSYVVNLHKANVSLDSVISYSNSYTPEFLCDVLPAIQADGIRWMHTVDFLHDVLPSLTRKTPDDHMDRSKMMKLNRCQWHDHSGPGGRWRCIYCRQESVSAVDLLNGMKIDGMD